MTDHTVPAPGHVAGLPHALPARVLLGTAAALFALTAATVAMSRVNLGAFNVVAAIGIAAVKASLVALFFMHLLHDRPMNALIFVVGLVFLAVFLMLCLVDVETRLPVRPTNVATPALRNAA